ncbi:hypothetical protein MYX07_02415 [Patescibacteria group bacterium AH-259-L07]|nr:hypothetical protein [Patescibacteria group bacterium AH-259-L07]
MKKAQKVVHIATLMALADEGDVIVAAEYIKQEVAEINALGWTVNSMIPLSYAYPPENSASRRMIVTDIALLISKQADNE